MCQTSKKEKRKFDMSKIPKKNCFGKTPAERAFLLLFQNLLYILEAIGKTNSESYDTYIFLDLGMKQINISKGGVKPAPPIF